MRLLALAPAAAMLLGFAATPAFADLKDDYMAACMSASGDNTELCTCKTTEAMKLNDDELLGYVIINMKEPAKFAEMVNKGEVPKAIVTKWPFYVRDTNKVCLPPAN